METYNSKEASRIAGVSLRQIQYWDERGFIRPSVKAAQGRGSKRLYSFHDLLCLKVMKDLTHRGLSLQKVRRCLQPLRRYSAEHGRALESLRYLTDGEKLFVITSDREKIFDAIDRQFVFSVGIGNLVRELNNSLRRAAAATGRANARTMRRYVEKQAGYA
ncbi:MAG TPA: MerR family transcriptional regulator [Candidatus Binatia bacterium]|jgi:DNA-binding transcriptional MerR regulator|nr:MerR family transcriptional regulator [Candidatus Binatia bacterium]